MVSQKRLALKGACGISSAETSSLPAVPLPAVSRIMAGAVSGISLDTACGLMRAMGGEPSESAVRP